MPDGRLADLGRASTTPSACWDLDAAATETATVVLDARAREAAGKRPDKKAAVPPDCKVGVQKAERSARPATATGFSRSC